MALTRTDTALLLESDDGLFYWVELEDLGDSIIVPDADDEDPQADDGSDGYVALVGDDAQVWRWKLKSTTVNGTLHVDHDITLSPNQSETSDTTIDIELAGVTYKVSIGVEDDGAGNDVPLLYVDISSERSGQTTLTFTTSGALSGRGAIAGASTLTFTVSANTDGTAEIQGTSTLTFSPSGSLRGAGALAGSSTVTFSGSVTLTGSVGISGATTLTFSASGSGTISGTLQASGASSLTFTATGTLLGLGAEVPILYSTGNLSAWYVSL